MTHDELLTRLLVTDKTNMTMEVIKWQLALYAVVELHKPVRRGAGEPYCDAICQWDYPCSTIQTIQRALA